MEISVQALTLQGSPSERGVAYGQAAAERIRRGLDFYAKFFADAGIDTARVRALGVELAARIGDFDAAMLAELEGIARGAQVTLGDVISLNARSELMRISGEGCTAVACLPPNAASHTLLAQNWDWHPSCIETGVLLRILPEDGPAIMTFGEAGSLGRCGLNQYGVGVVGNALECEGCTRPSGIPIAVLRRRLLGCRTVTEAVEATRQTPRGTSANHLLASANGAVVACESTPEDVYEVSPEAGLLAHSNHFLSPRARREIIDTGIKSHPDTLERADRIRELLAPMQPVGVRDIQEALGDHRGHPTSICRHASSVNMRTWVTAASIVMDLEERRLWLTAGPPCEHPYIEHSLFDAARA